MKVFQYRSSFTDQCRKEELVDLELIEKVKETEIELQTNLKRR